MKIPRLSDVLRENNFLKLRVKGYKTRVSTLESSQKIIHKQLSLKDGDLLLGRLDECLSDRSILEEQYDKLQTNFLLMVKDNQKLNRIIKKIKASWNK